MILKNIPNALTITRLALTLPFLIFLNNQQYTNALYVFLIAGFTDGLDGWLARYFNWQSIIGSFIDPLADKLLIASSFISLAFIGALPWWLVILVFLRDITLSFGAVAWYYFIQRRLEFKPTMLSKINTLLQLMLVTMCLFDLAFFKVSLILTDVLIVLTATTTSITYIDYVWTWGRKACSGNHQTP